MIYLPNGNLVKISQTNRKHFSVSGPMRNPITSISANADGPHDAASRKIDHIALLTKYNYQATSVG